MYVVEYRYEIDPQYYKEFKKIQNRVYDIYKANGVMYHILLIDEEKLGEILELMMFNNEENYEAFKIATESNLELYSLTEKFSKMVINPEKEHKMKVYTSIFSWLSSNVLAISPFFKSFLL